MLKEGVFKPSQNRLSLARFFLLGMLGIVLISMLAIVVIQHEIRNLETDYAKSLKIQNQQREEWGRLSLEKHHLSAPARVEQVAREKLNMTIESSREANNRHVIRLEVPVTVLNSDLNP